jgi:hypothetical protein
MVTVKRVNQAQVHSVELPVDLPCEDLAAIMSSDFGWDSDDAGRPVSYDIEAHPPGRMLEPTETLASAGIVDGTWLVFHPRLTTQLPGSADQSPPLEAMHDVEENSSRGYVWKRIDPDDANLSSISRNGESEMSPSYKWKRIDKDE